jgi:hypothetical protein
MTLTSEAGGVDVLAPNDLVRAWPGGELTICPSQGFNDGEWVRHSSGVRP